MSRLLSACIVVAFVFPALAADEPKKIDPELAKLIAQLQAKKSPDRVAALEAIAKRDDAVQAYEAICQMLADEQIDVAAKAGLAALKAISEPTADAAYNIVRLEGGGLDLWCNNLTKLEDKAKVAYPALAVRFKKISNSKTFMPQDAMRVVNAMILIDHLNPATMKSLQAAHKQKANCSQAIGTSLFRASKLDPKDAEAKKKTVVFLIDLIPIASVNPADRVKVIKAIGGFGADAKPAVPVLKGLAKDPSESVRKAAKAVLDDIE